MSDLNLDKEPSQGNQQNPYNPPGNVPPLPTEIWGMTPDTYLMLLHLSQLLSFSGAGIAVPIVMWALNKDKFLEVDIQGRIVLNWMISWGIYTAVSFLLCLVFIGFLLIPAFGILNIVFPIIGAVKANNGIRWKYPLSIPFFNVD